MKKVVGEVYYHLNRNFGITQVLPNVIGMVTVENNNYINRIRDLIDARFKHRAISVEPMLGEVDLMETAIEPYKYEKFCPPSYRTRLIHMLNWVIVGGESGPGARPMNPDWAWTIRDQCIAADVPFFFKQLKLINGKMVHMPVLDGKIWNQTPKIK